ncbi:MAG: hypothetical protein U0136_16785 [Bdellovibrionota bacterium]
MEPRSAVNGEEHSGPWEGLEINLESPADDYLDEGSQEVVRAQLARQRAASAQAAPSGQQVSESGIYVAPSPAPDEIQPNTRTKPVLQVQPFRDAAPPKIANAINCVETGV